jgi:hypothetical protein
LSDNLGNVATAVAKPLVNAPCPCGSGKKYKKCCRDIHEGASHVSARIESDCIRGSEHLKRYGKVRPPVHAELRGHRFIAVGDDIFRAPASEPPQNFLAYYFVRLFGAVLWDAEMQKPLAQAHPLARLARGVISRREQDSGCRPDGPELELQAVAYDLYVLKHNGAYQRSLLERLRIPDQYQGARYELLVAACFIRGGFDLNWFNERQQSNRRPEFLAIHRKTGFSIAVEAKSKKRTGAPRDAGRLNVSHLIDDALSKVVEGCYAVFVDVNLPRRLSPRTTLRFESLATEELGYVRKLLDAEGRERAGLIRLTNNPLEEGEPPLFQWLVRRAGTPAVKVPRVVADDLERAVKLFGNLPFSFEGESRLPSRKLFATKPPKSAQFGKRH